MSSVVNKGGTRFAPKMRQRRTAASGSPAVGSIATPVISIQPTKEVDDIGNGEVNDSATLVATQVTTQDLDGDEGPLAKGTQEEDVDPKQVINTEEKRLSISGPTDRHQRRFSRLPSLSGTLGSPLLKPSLAGSNNTNRRLSTISKNPKKKKILSMNKLLSENEDDATLNAIKKRRLSRTVPPATRRSKSSRKSSVISKIFVPQEAHSEEDEEGDNLKDRRDSMTDTVPNDGEYFETYIVRNIDEVPADVTITDSARYLVDDEHFTMDQLCKRTLPIGQISENFDKARNAEKQKILKRKERHNLRKRAREEFKSLQSLNKEEEDLEKEEWKKNREKLLNAEIPEFGAPKGQQMQLKIGADGKMILDEESTVVDRHRNANLENAQKEKLDENPFENLYNNASYGKSTYTDPWTLDEIIKLYKALAMWGTDFNLISQMFPYRTRKQVKAKFVNEERKHPIIIELALRAKLPANFDVYCTDIRKELGTVDDFNEKMAQIQSDHEKNIQEIEKAKESAKIEDMNIQKDGDLDKKSSGGFRKKYLNTYRKSEVVLGTIDDVKKLRKIKDDAVKEEGEEDKSDNDEEEKEDGEEDREEEEEKEGDLSKESIDEKK
ncbi:similar to Saccharomyces cerevisiae YNL039W BDP1 Essential subunit of RNA polymerase III transcription factor (TFIIIB) [Maudiozyma barnettii]|uniref:Similar to Saccharomyces cerevisiae YNL039W BDP1 Essential subunit of RNA polymerase III transcription factor (TFIIIB) n=1 Tax=Maudiozyma barnettii TaxID=61262 RepID=A0A8H2ZI72_9SACH|nr:transcription factor TFIIIB subunit BDP1 [Kazachstania barnettii]CAB4252804.1 similar to Saccharomyces cerevisiae YNL039W BDP1 Essential subunit of RNA polymerase III transcription factor (TFIIIB) [Kazachstania barnettii]CAD1780594.1 similar to Saccharomyces cerevisiae YNL039W BDP1 Essential subunit of RNA polymerase III transcription factor (TFIIIB) [Kazachstania barnettii]